MIWLTWRQLRMSAAAAFAAVAAMAVVLAMTGPRVARLGRIDANIFDRLSRTDRNLYLAGIIVVAVAPAVIGAFWGAPMVARELEAGTHRLVWNQSVTRGRWLGTKLGITALFAAAAAGILTFAVTWWSAALDGAQSRTRGSLPARVTPVAFAMRGIAPVGYAVFAVVLGVAVGIVLRKTLPAMALTLALFTFVQVAVPLWIRPHLATPVQQSVAFSRGRLDGIMQSESGGTPRITVNTGEIGSWVLSNKTVNAAGRVTSVPTWFASCIPSPGPAPVAGAFTPVKDIETCFARLNREGYRQRIVFQPAAAFWRLQWAETALFLAVSAVLAAFCLWWTRRRLS